MATHNKMTVSVQPTGRRPTSAERRAAQIASLATKQADLKREAAERRAERAKQDPPPPSRSRVRASARRSNSR